MYLSDLHTHSIASGHGTRSTVTDMARSAAAKGLRLLGITDHGPATLSAGTASYFRSLLYSPRKRFGIELLYGAELNILDTEGHVDLESDVQNELDYCIASMHRPNYKPLSKEENTKAFLRVMTNPNIKILGHCDNPTYPVDYDLLIKGVRDYGVLPEINEASLTPGSYRGNAKPNAAAILESCSKYGVPLVLSSDSHGPSGIGNFTYGSAFVHNALFPEELILNNQIPRLKIFLMER